MKSNAGRRRTRQQIKSGYVEAAGYEVDVNNAWKRMNNRRIYNELVRIHARHQGGESV